MNGFWEWEVSTGKLYTDQGELRAVGYSGAPGHKNNIQSVALHNEGPIPPGTYTIHEPRNTEEHGPYVLPLEPDASNEMYGRSGFLIHGDSKHAPGTASQGCVILPLSIREEIWESGDHRLQVVEKLPEEDFV